MLDHGGPPQAIPMSAPTPLPPSHPPSLSLPPIYMQQNDTIGLWIARLRCATFALDVQHIVFCNVHLNSSTKAFMRALQYEKNRI